MSVFRELLAIKAFRENQAEGAMRAQRQALADAVAAREQAEDLLARLLREGLQIEQQLYRELCERLVRLRDIEDVQLSVAGLRQREAAQQQALEQAEQAQREQDEKLVSARAAHQEAARQKSKFVDLARNWDQLQSREAERREDLEMEEAASVARDREEWQGHDPEAGA
ncbi:type III secretion protein [Melaminivora suipulveris]|uniref:Type III secretion protein n=1 Tax=Melaminivora suipulveris TaxID=2109913 RepID=A0A2R3QFP4_9BURK|nr:YscO family type III secretion system apparatus protein [Melaminivora suipulveris]AVO50570.1 type III secretion protein [Melaminivora suipulveris]